MKVAPLAGNHEPNIAFRVVRRFGPGVTRLRRGALGAAGLRHIQGLPFLLRGSKEGMFSSS